MKTSQLDFERDGITYIPGAFSAADMAAFESAILRMATRISADLGFALDADDVYDLKALERASVPGFFSLCSHAGGTIAALRLLASPAIAAVASKIFGWRADSVLPQHPFLFWNDHETPRLAYDWHQECSFYNGVEQAAHLWFPVFNDVGEDDGPMLVALGSHKEKHAYVYEKPKDGVTQLHVADEVVSRYGIHACSVKRGDAVIFHHNLIHSTGKIKSARPRMAAVARLVDTISARKFQPIMECTFKAGALDAIKADAAEILPEGV